MNRVWLVVVIIGVVLVVAAALFLYSWDIPAPQEHVEQELSDDRISN